MVRGKPCGKAHVVDDPLPAAVRQLRFHVRRHGLKARLPGGIHGTGGEIFNEAVQQQPQRMGCRPRAQIERERVLVGEAGKGQIGKVAHVCVIARAQQFAHVAAFVIPCSGNGVRVRAQDGTPGSERTLIEKALVGVHLGGCGMIDATRRTWSMIVDLFHRFTEAQAEISSARAKLRTFHLDPFIRVGVVFRRRRNPVANDCGADHVGDELVFRSVPGKQRGTGAAPAVQFRDAQSVFFVPTSVSS